MQWAQWVKGPGGVLLLKAANDRAQGKTPEQLLWLFKSRSGPALTCGHHDRFVE
jgi:hypothetical protein